MLAALTTLLIPLLTLSHHGLAVGDHFDPDLSIHGRRLYTSVQYNHTYPDVPADKHLCLKVQTASYNAPGQAVQFSECLTDQQNQLEPSRQFTVSYPRPSDDTAPHGIFAPVTVHTGVDNKDKGCLTANFVGARREQYTGVPLTVEKCETSKLDYQQWKVFGGQLRMMGSVNGARICLEIDANSGPDPAGAFWRKARAIVCRNVDPVPPTPEQKFDFLGTEAWWRNDAVAEYQTQPMP